MLSRDNEATVLTASAIAKASTGARGIPSFRLLFRWEIAAIVGKVVISVWRVGGRVWTTTSFIYWTARAGQQGRRELRHSGMTQQLWLKRGRRLATRRSRFGRATAVWRRCCICRGSPEFTLRCTTLRAANYCASREKKKPRSRPGLFVTGVP
jgi:hypothetical protein